MDIERNEDGKFKAGHKPIFSGIGSRGKIKKQCSVCGDLVWLANESKKLCQRCYHRQYARLYYERYKEKLKERAKKYRIRMDDIRKRERQYYWRNKDRKIKNNIRAYSRSHYNGILKQGCYICGTKENVGIHHIVYRYPPKTEDCITLCDEHHKKVDLQEVINDERDFNGKR